MTTWLVKVRWGDGRKSVLAHFEDRDDAQGFADDMNEAEKSSWCYVEAYEA